jgi:hypothetical protein
MPYIMFLIFYPFLILFCFLTFPFLMIFNFYLIKKLHFKIFRDHHNSARDPPVSEKLA